MAESIKENAVFRRLYYRGANASNRYLAVYCRPNRLDRNRLGLTVSAKLGHAVVRNRTRRRLRELFRALEPQLKCGYDIVVVARGAAVEAEFTALGHALSALFDRLDLLSASETTQ